MARKWLLNEGGFIDPAHDAGSYVAARIGKPRREASGPYVDFTADVVLADCNRSIRWSFNTTAHALEKVRAVIDRLQRFERGLIEAQRLHKIERDKAQAQCKREADKKARKAKRAPAAKPASVRVTEWPEL